METVSLNYLKQYLRDNIEETQFLELLDITTADLVMMFDDKISDRFDYLIAKLELDKGVEDDFYEGDERVTASDDTDQYSVINMAETTLMFSKTFRSEDWVDREPTIKPIKKKKTGLKPASKKQLLDLLEEHNDGYPSYDDESDRLRDSCQSHSPSRESYESVCQAVPVSYRDSPSQIWSRPTSPSTDSSEA